MIIALPIVGGILTILPIIAIALVSLASRLEVAPGLPQDPRKPVHNPWHDRSSVFMLRAQGGCFMHVAAGSGSCQPMPCRPFQRKRLLSSPAHLHPKPNDAAPDNAARLDQSPRTASTVDLLLDMPGCEQVPGWPGRGNQRAWQEGRPSMSPIARQCLSPRTPNQREGQC